MWIELDPPHSLCFMMCLVFGLFHSPCVVNVFGVLEKHFVNERCCLNKVYHHYYYYKYRIRIKLFSCLRGWRPPEENQSPRRSLWALAQLISAVWLQIIEECQLCLLHFWNMAESWGTLWLKQETSEVIWKKHNKNKSKGNQNRKLRRGSKWSDTVTLEHWLFSSQFSFCQGEKLISTEVVLLSGASQSQEVCSMSTVQHSAHYFWCIRCLSRTGTILESGIQ